MQSYSVEHLQQMVSNAIALLPVYKEPSGLYEPISYTMNQGGKRLRPLLTLVAAQMFGGNPERALPAATAIEIFHNFTLLHDDIIDQAPLRRGAETVYKKWNINTAILSGDTMFAIAYGQLSASDPELLPGLMDVFTRTAIEVCEGQQYDIDFETTESVSLEEYITMIRLKTAVLLAASLKIGAIIGGASTEEAGHIYAFGENIGIAFQLQDDYLDAFGDERTFGKKTGGDIVVNKKTYLYLKALQNASEADKHELQAIYSGSISDPAEKVGRVLDIFVRNGVQESTRDIIASYYNKGMESLKKIRLKPEALEPLMKLISGMLDRKF
ncbi:MAG TPA: polyprenyl synthetase family protein [Lentimicrobium sp.]|jgi:geranylgeranyl diphosphate synthase type II|nr:polyprenyl synthetase family protein [Lentimicrobium sp.]